MKKVTIIGSINVDNIMHIKALPKPGETVAMSAFSQAAGGKGANQEAVFLIVSATISID